MSSKAEFVFKESEEETEAWCLPLVEYAHATSVLLQPKNLYPWAFTEMIRIQHSERYEYLEKDGDEPVAGIIAFTGYDQHVGECLTVQWAISKQRGRLTRGYRKLIELARYLEIPYICYTKETAPMTYTMRYIKVID